jgi:hypothetical protein
LGKLLHGFKVPLAAEAPRGFSSLLRVLEVGHFDFVKD